MTAAPAPEPPTFVAGRRNGERDFNKGSIRCPYLDPEFQDAWFRGWVAAWDATVRNVRTMGSAADLPIWWQRETIRSLGAHCERMIDDWRALARRPAPADTDWSTFYNAL